MLTNLDNANFLRTSLLCTLFLSPVYIKYQMPIFRSDNSNIKALLIGQQIDYFQDFEESQDKNSPLLFLQLKLHAIIPVDYRSLLGFPVSNKLFGSFHRNNIHLN